MDERDFPSRKDIFGGQIIHFPRNISRKLKFRQGFNTDNRFLLTLEYPPRFWNVFVLFVVLLQSFFSYLSSFNVSTDLHFLRKRKDNLQTQRFATSTTSPKFQVHLSYSNLMHASTSLAKLLNIANNMKNKKA